MIIPFSLSLLTMTGCSLFELQHINEYDPENPNHTTNPVIGIFSETYPSNLVSGGLVNIDTDNVTLSYVQNTGSGDGNECALISIAPDASWGLDYFSTSTTNLNAFINGGLYFEIAFTTANELDIRIASYDNFNTNFSVYVLSNSGATNDGDWWSVRIPFSEFQDINPSLDFNNIIDYFGITSPVPSGSDDTIYYDNVYITNGWPNPSSAPRRTVCWHKRKSSL
jgi:hypothetical protein